MKRFLSWALLLLCCVLSSCAQGEEEVVPEPPKKETLHILAFGNSFTQDALAYLPFLFESMNPHYNLHLELACIGGGRLEDHLNYLLNDDEYGCNVYWPGANVWDGKPRRASQLLKKRWDLILFNQKSTLSTDYDSYEASVPWIVEFIQQHLKHPCTLGWLITHTIPESNHVELFEQQSTCIQQLCREYGFEVVLPCGTATENARQTSLSGIADGKFLTCEDNWHLQDGIPCLTEAYAATATLFQWLGVTDCVLFPFPLGPDFLTQKQIPGVNGSLIQGNLIQVMKARECAIEAVKHPFEITIQE